MKMSYTKPEGFISGEYYHVYNRGVEKRNIFDNEADYKRFRSSLKDFNSTDPAWKIEWAKEKGEILKGEMLVEIVAYCLNPNHFHLLLKQIRDNGISDFMRKLGTGHTMYFNKKHDRSGVLFQGKFKSVHVKDNNHLLYLSAYVNRNYFIHGYGDDANWPYSSLWDYTGERDGKICEKGVILDKFKDKKDYQKFIQENALYMKEKKEDEKYLLE